MDKLEKKYDKNLLIVLKYTRIIKKSIELQEKVNNECIKKIKEKYDKNPLITLRYVKIIEKSTKLQAKVNSECIKEIEKFVINSN